MPANGGCSPIVYRDSLRARAESDARRERVSLAIRHPRAVAISQGHIRTCCTSTATSTASTTSRRESTSGLVRRQLELARAGLVPGELSCSSSRCRSFITIYGDDFKVECPTGSGNMMNLWEVSQEISHRLSRIFLKDGNGRRPVFGENEKFQTDPHFRDHILFYEYFHGDNGARRRSQPPNRVDRAGRETAAAKRRIGIL